MNNYEFRSRNIGTLTMLAHSQKVAPVYSLQLIDRVCLMRWPG